MTNENLQERLVDDIYEAALVPDRWPDLFEAIGRPVDAALGSLFVFRSEVVRWIGTPAADALIADFVALGKPELNTRISRGHNYTRDGFANDLDFFTPEDIEREPFYRDFLYPRGYGWVAATRFELPTGDVLYYSWERKRERGPYERDRLDLLDSLRPHLGRAALLAARLDLKRMQAMTAALEAVGLPAAVLRGEGRIYAANDLLSQLIPTAMEDRAPRLRLVHPAADALFESALERIVRRGPQNGVNSIPVPASEVGVPLVAHLVPIRGAANDVFSRATALMVVTPIDRKAVPSAEVLQGLFDLTPAEARVARAIGEGRTVEQISLESEISVQTVRSQLKAVMAKTGTGRQPDLVLLLAAMRLP